MNIMGHNPSETGLDIFTQNVDLFHISCGRHGNLDKPVKDFSLNFCIFYETNLHNFWDHC